MDTALQAVSLTWSKLQKEESEMQEILDRIENALALAGYEIVSIDETIGDMWVYDKKQDFHYRITVKN